MVATDLKQIRSLMRRDSSYGGVFNTEGLLIILKSLSILFLIFLQPEINLLVWN